MVYESRLATYDSRLGFWLWGFIWFLGLLLSRGGVFFSGFDMVLFCFALLLISPAVIIRNHRCFPTPFPWFLYFFSALYNEWPGLAYPGVSALF